MVSSEWLYGPSRAVRNNDPAHIDIEPTEDPEWPLYWAAWVVGERVNGGLGLNQEDCIARAKRAIEQWRTQWFLRHNDWDHVNREWFAREVPLT